MMSEPVVPWIPLHRTRLLPLFTCPISSGGSCFLAFMEGPCGVLSLPNHTCFPKKIHYEFSSKKPSWFGFI